MTRKLVQSLTIAAIALAGVTAVQAGNSQPTLSRTIDRGVAESSASDNRWHECTFVGERSVAARLALDEERDLILVKVGVASDLIVEIESLIEICQTYELDGGPHGSALSHAYLGR